MLTSLYDANYRHLIQLLIAARKEQKITQNDLAFMLGKPQSFVSKYENCERRIDVIEFINITTSLKVDYLDILSGLETKIMSGCKK